MKQKTIISLLCSAMVLLVFSCDFMHSQKEALNKGYTSLLCVKKDGKFGFVNEIGKEVIQCKFDQPSVFSEGWAALKKGKNWSYYNAHGRKVLDLKKRYTYCGPFHDGAAFVTTVPTKDMLHNYAAFYEDLCQEIQFINTKGEVIFKVEDKWGINCSQIVRIGFSDGLLKVINEKSDPKMIGYLDKSGQLKIPFKSLHQSMITDAFSDGLLVSGEKEYNKSKKAEIKYGYIDQLGQWQIPPIYTKALPFNHGVAVVWEENPKRENSYKTYLIDKEGKSVFPSDIRTSERLVRDSLLAVYRPKLNEDGVEVFGSYGKNRRYAIAKVDGSMVTDFIFAQLQPGKTSQDLWEAGLPENEAYGFVDDEGTVIIPYQFPSVWNSFEDGLAVVRVADKGKATAVINTKGEMVLPPDSIENYQISGEVICPNDRGGFSYFNRFGEAINLKEYEHFGIYQHLSLPNR